MRCVRRGIFRKRPKTNEVFWAAKFLLQKMHSRVEAMIELEIMKTRKETSDVKTVVFEKPEGFDFKPGQYILMELCLVENDPRGNKRPFTISSSPTENFLMVSTKISKSAFKKKFDSLKKGDTVKINGPLGSFVLQDSRKHAMLAGGIGVTPFRSMLKYSYDKKTRDQITVLYSNKSPDEIAFKEDMENMKTEKIRIVKTITGEFDGWNGKKGRIDENIIKDYCELDSVFYICGPPGFVDALKSVLENMNIRKDKIKIEKFSGY
jgi:glycine betaine catabolism B